MTPRPKSVVPATVLVGALLALAGCESPSFEPLSYTDGTVTLNDRCPVRHRPLNAKLEPLWINQHPVGFC